MIVLDLRGFGYSSAHVVGFAADADEQARNAFSPDWYDIRTTLGPERGWPTPTHAQFDGVCALASRCTIGSPATVATMLRRLSDALSRGARVNLQVSAASGNHAAFLDSIDLPGEPVNSLLPL